MPKYAYKALTADGQKITGEQDAISEQALIAKLQQQGLIPASVNLSKHDNPSKRSGLFTRKENISQKTLALMMSDMATLLDAGLPIDHAVNRLQRHCKNPLLKDSLANIHTALQKGITLSAAMEAEQHTFSKIQINMVRAGEASGHLPQVLSELASFMEKNVALRSTVISALIYPAILAVMALLSIFIMMAFVIPQFVPIFEDAGQALPLLTQIVFQLSALIQQSWWLIILVLMSVILLADRYLKMPDNRLRMDRLLLRLPVIGPMLSSFEAARLSRTLATLLKNGVSLVTAVHLTSQVLANKAIINALNTSQDAIESGEKLAASLQKSRLFPDLLTELVAVGEESGKLPQMLMKAADNFDRDIDIATKRLLALLEPALIIGMGLIIGVMIVSILLAMLGLNDLVG